MDEMFILEHPTRGIVMAVPGDIDDNYHFSWSKPMNEAMPFNRAQAIKHLALCPIATRIRTWGKWEVVE